MVTFAAGTLARFAHQAAETHARCPEHGELIHVDGAGPAVAGGGGHGNARVADVAHTVDVEPGASAHSGGSEPAGHEHDHCYLCPTSRDQSTAPATDGPTYDPFHTALAYRAPVSESPAPSRIYRTAPKQSPPA